MYAVITLTIGIHQQTIFIIFLEFRNARGRDIDEWRCFQNFRRVPFKEEVYCEEEILLYNTAIDKIAEIAEHYYCSIMGILVLMDDRKALR